MSNQKEFKQHYDDGYNEGYGDCYESDHASFVGEVQPLIDAILTQNLDTWDPIRIIAEKINIQFPTVSK